jgi:hypothetical protein
MGTLCKDDRSMVWCDYLTQGFGFNKFD